MAALRMKLYPHEGKEPNEEAKEEIGNSRSAQVGIVFAEAKRHQ